MKRTSLLGLAALIGASGATDPRVLFKRGAAPNAENFHRGEMPDNHAHERIRAQAKRKSGKRPKPR